MCLQETWLYSYQQVANLPNKFETHFKSIDQEDSISHPYHLRASAGTANLWASHHFNSLADGTHRINVLEDGKNNVAVINVYLPPRGKYPNATFKEEVDQLHEICIKFENYSLILAGDFNIDTNKKHDSRSRYLVDFLKLHHLEEPFKITEPSFTQHNGRGSSKIDYIYINQHLRQRASCIEYKLLDDHPYNTSTHRPVLIRLDLKYEKVEESKQVRYRLDWDKVDVPLYTNTLEQYLEVSAPCVDTDMAASHLMEALHGSAAIAVPRRKIKPRKAPWNHAIAKAKKESKAAHYAWIVSGKPDRRHPTSALRYAAKKSLRRAQRQQAAKNRRESLQKLMMAKEEDSALFHSIIRRQRSSKSANTKELLLGNHLYTDNLLPAWDDHFTMLASPKEDDNYTHERLRLVETNLRAIVELAEPDQLPFQITRWEVTAAINQLKKKKASDTYGLVSEHLKVAPALVADFLTPIINRICQTGKIPDMLKEGLLHPIHKKGKPKDIPGNYRGITITPVVTKILDTIILNHQNAASPGRCHPLQFGFTKGRSPLHAAFLLTEAIAESKDNGEPLFVASLDVEKAFDTVQHNSLLDKLHQLGVQGVWWRLKRDSYQGLASRTMWKGEKSANLIQIKQGNGQGKTTSPDDYISHLHNLLEMTSEGDLGYNIGSTCVSTPTCADDMLILATNIEELQAVIQLIEYYANAEHYNIHPTKSSVVLFNTKSDKLQQYWLENSPFSLNGTSLPMKKQMLHLGITRNTTSTSPTVDERITTMRRTMYALMGSGLYGMNGLPVAVSLHLYKIYTLPRGLFGLEALNMGKTDIKKMENAHRQFLRRVLGLPERTASAGLYILAGTLPMEYLLHISKLKYLLSLLSSPTTREVVLRQYVMKSYHSHSWVYQTKTLLEKYGLPSIGEIAESTIAKKEWKKKVDNAVFTHATEQIRQEATQKSTLKHINPIITALIPHHCLRDIENPLQVVRANIKSRILMDVYPLNTNRKRMKQISTDECDVCNNGAKEDIRHFLLECHSLDETRRKYRERIDAILPDSTSVAIQANPALLLTLLLDPTHTEGCGELACQLPDLPRLESLTRDYIYALHIKRSQLLKT